MTSANLLIAVIAPAILALASLILAALMSDD